MRDYEDTLRIARDKWVSGKIAMQMIQVVMPPNLDPRRSANQILLDGAIERREILKALHPTDRARAVRRRPLHRPEYEWNLESLILRLLSLHSVASWPVPVTVILKLATIEPDQLPVLALEKLSEMQRRLPSSAMISDTKKTSADRSAPTNEAAGEFDDVKNKTVEGVDQITKNTILKKPQKIRGQRPDPLWSNVLGWAAGWLAVNGEPLTRAELERKIEDRFLSLEKEAGDTQIGAYADGLLEGYRAHKKSKSRNSR